MNLNLHQIEAFARVARLGGFSRAAEQMHLSQAGLSILIRKLEERLGIKLFERQARGVTLTPAGKGLLPIADRMLQDARFILNHGEQLAGDATRRITLALPPLLAASLLPDVLRQFRQSHPQVIVSFRECLGDELVQRVYTRDVDFALAFQAPDAGELDCLQIGRDQLSVAHAPDHALASLARVRWVDLLAHPIIVNAPGSGARVLAENAFAEQGEVFEPAYETGNHLTAVVLAGKGLGVAVVSSTTQSLAPALNAVVRTLQGPQIVRPLQMVKRRSAELPAAATAFLDLFGKAAARDIAQARVPIAKRLV